MEDLQHQINELEKTVKRIEDEYLQTLKNANEALFATINTVKDLHERLERLEESICG